MKTFSLFFISAISFLRTGKNKDIHAHGARRSSRNKHTEQLLIIVETIDFTERKTKKNLSRHTIMKLLEKNDVHKLELNIQSEKERNKIKRRTRRGLTARCTEEASNKQNKTRRKKRVLMCYFDRITVYTNKHTHTHTHRKFEQNHCSFIRRELFFSFSLIDFVSLDHQ